MHQSWNGGANDGWLPAKVSNSPLQGNVPVPMGYYTRKDLPIHYLLADTFTICDQYHCSLLGGTTPNRLYWMSAWIDPDGTHGGPVRVEPNIQPLQHYSWRIMPENLDDAGVSWKVYQNKVLGALNNTVIGYNGLVNDVKQAGDPSSSEAGCRPRPSSIRPVWQAGAATAREIWNSAILFPRLPYDADARW